jgi:hypothetical protein
VSCLLSGLVCSVTAPVAAVRVRMDRRATAEVSNR